MKYTQLISIGIGVFLLVFIINSQAEGLMMTRAHQKFPEAMLKLQASIVQFNYKISRVQRIDIGLTKNGYETDKYRIVFFANEEEMTLITKRFPHLIPDIPWKISIFEEREDILLVAADPMKFSNKKFPGADKYLMKWKNDIRKILALVQKDN